MFGITGSGKSTFAKKMYDYVTSKGASCLIVSADKWSKRGFKGKDMQNEILKEIQAFESTPNEYKYLIMDLCNENGENNYYFGFDTTEYTKYRFYPNIDITKVNSLFNDYQCWCLKNVITRPMHTDDSLYWLNPESAGLKTCIMVHNKKTKGIKKLFNVTSTVFGFNEDMDYESLMSSINSKASKYAEYLSAFDNDLIVQNFIKHTGFIV